MWQNTSTGNEEIINQKANFRINTTNTEITIQSNLQNISEVALYNIQGVEINCWKGNEQSVVSLNLYNIQGGVYFLQINRNEFKKIFITV